VVTTGTHPGIALADPAALEQLLAHLIQNAVDASGPSDPVTLAVSADAAQVNIDVIDTGTGMSPGFVRDRLFKPFVSSKPGGFGIGAYEARQLATGMQGRVEVVSREGVGSRFRVVLKAAHVVEQAA
jgi:signal transduction histidine kinase